MTSKEIADSRVRNGGIRRSVSTRPTDLKQVGAGAGATTEALERADQQLRTANAKLTSSNAALRHDTEDLDAQVADLENVQESLGAPLLLVDQNLIVRRFNQAMRAAFDLGPESLGRPLRPTDWNAGLADLPERILAVMASGEAYEREIVRGRRHFKLRASPLSSHRHAVAGAVLLFDDITELVETRRALKRGEAELRATLLQAQSASAAKSLFLSNMSHEFRTPLNAIMGFSEVISKEIMGPVGQAKYKEYALDIHTSAEHLRAIISRVLDLSKVEAGKLDLSESVCDATGLVGDAARMLAGSCNTKGVILEAQVPRRSLWLRCDPAMVRQMVINLAQNAISFSQTGQIVRIKLLRCQSRQVKLIVCDHGIGMTDAEIEVALRPFGQIRNPQWAASSSSGLGLGLPLVKCMAELHGASFEIKSRKGRGTTVTVQFPPERSVGKRPPAAPANAGTA